MDKTMVKKISFPSSLKNIDDIYDANLDVFVELKDGSEYTVIVGTPKNLLTLMNRDGMDFLEPGCLFLIVKELTIEVIEKAIHAHTQDNAYWLKLHHFSGSITNDMFKKLQEDEDRMHDSFDIN